MHIAGGSSGKESTCNAGDLSDPWVGNIPWRREWLPTPVFWPGEFHGLYIVHGVTKIWTRLSDFHFHFDIWHLAGWLKKQKMITPIYLAPGQVKARWEWKEGGDMVCSRWEAQRPGGWGGKGPTCEDANWYGDGTAEGPLGPVVSEQKQKWCQGRWSCQYAVWYTVGGLLKEAHPPGLVTKWWLEDSNSSPGTLSRANPRESGETVWTKEEPGGLRPSAEGPGSLTIGNKWQGPPTAQETQILPYWAQRFLYYPQCHLNLK